MAGTHSEAPKFAEIKSQEDKYVSVTDKAECHYYRKKESTHDPASVCALNMKPWTRTMEEGPGQVGGELIKASGLWKTAEMIHLLASYTLQPIVGKLQVENCYLRGQNVWKMLLWGTWEDPTGPVTKEGCERHQKYVPGSQLAGEGVDITTLQFTGFNPIDPTQFLGKNESCVLCHNDLQAGERQRLPLAIKDWQTKVSKCQRTMAESAVTSAIEIATLAAKSIQKNWVMELEANSLTKANVQMAVAGSYSKAATFAAQKAQEDECTFTSNIVECHFYSLHLIKNPPLKPDFKSAIWTLPDKFTASTRPEYFQLISDYGTHFIKSLELGGRITDITALRTCGLALEGLQVEKVSECLAVETTERMDGSVKSSKRIKKCEKQRKKHGIQGSFHDMYNERLLEVVGGQHKRVAGLIFGATKGSEQFSAWKATLPASPGLVAYSLAPLHLLLKPQDPRREELRQALSEYLNKRTRWQNCTWPCPPGKMKSAQNPCRCVCPGSDVIDKNCCPRERGLATLEVTIIKANGLWGDLTSQTDAYVKVFFKEKELRVPTVWNENNPTWGQKLNFGIVQLARGGPLRVEVWDADNSWDDNLLGSCTLQPTAGMRRVEVCYLSSGSVTFQYLVTCVPHLQGPKCLKYAPVGNPEEGVGNLNSP
ncbi:perforin-1-like [Tachyglossus aculeatus]|uniref:perforin-1-like n=1 Tax=Tachyglossus aculeatus TaxID=9261 RepID=UPI0018F3353C|nr:perforin-1-like [Tachyglossus aculeatus]